MRQQIACRDAYQVWHKNCNIIANCLCLLVGCFVVQSVTGQAGTAAAVDTTVSDAVSAPSSTGAGSLFDLTGLLDTVSANAELSGVPATDAPPAALAVAALTANPTLVAAAVSKPLDVSSLSSVDAGLASLLMLKQTVSNGLVASAEAKSPTSGPAADLADNEDVRRAYLGG